MKTLEDALTAIRDYRVNTADPDPDFLVDAIEAMQAIAAAALQGEPWDEWVES